ncbi:MAG: nuclear transport factor 2 family protein [Stackebrandtia sp.]
MANLLEEYVLRHNRGLSSGDFTSMLELFCDDAEMTFVGLPVGPFVGRDAIAAAFRDAPPDDQLVLLSTACDGARISGGYGWRGRHGQPEGSLELTARDGKIARLTVVVTR